MRKKKLNVRYQQREKVIHRIQHREKETGAMKNILVPRKYKKWTNGIIHVVPGKLRKTLAGILIPQNPIFRVHHTVTHIHYVFAQT